MAQITIDTGDSAAVLKAVRNMISELLGECPAAILLPKTATADKAQEVHQSKPAAAMETTVETPTQESAPETATQGADAALEATDTVTSGTVDPNRLDEKGVPYDSRYCADAEKPFYSSRKEKGQWKRRKGVDQAAYDTWYADELEVVEMAKTIEGGNTEEASDGLVDTAAAFGAPSGTTAPEEEVPTNAGAFMGWLAKAQADGRLTQEQIGQAYTTAGVEVTHFFESEAEGRTPEAIAQSIAAVYTILAPLAVA